MIAMTRKMTSWINRRKAFVEEVEAMIKEGYDMEGIIDFLGKRGIARRTALEYYRSANG